MEEKRYTDLEIGVEGPNVTFTFNVVDSRLNKDEIVHLRLPLTEAADLADLMLTPLRLRNHVEKTGAWHSKVHEATGMQPGMAGRISITPSHHQGDFNLKATYWSGCGERQNIKLPLNADAIAQIARTLNTACYIIVGESLRMMQ